MPDMHNLIDTWDSACGRALLLRCGQLDDVDRLMKFERHLSPGTKYFRFGRFRDLRFTQEQLRWILDPENQGNVHFVVTTMEDSEVEILATARLLIGKPTVAGELLLVVRDDWQGRGLGARLTAALCAEASRRRIPGICCQVMPTNRRMQAFIQKCGFRQVQNPDHDLLLRFEKRLNCFGSSPS